LENKKIFLEIYEKLLKEYGHQNWWPIHENTDEFLEISIGAILTQNTSWKNVEKAINNLILSGVLDWENLEKIDLTDLKELIKPAGFYNQKAKYIKNFINAVKNKNKEKITRKFLLSIKGIGKETADCILLYGLNKHYFVVDTYTKRIFSRIGIVNENIEYDKLQLIFKENLPEDVNLYKEYHALIVEHGKNICRKKPDCYNCVLADCCGKIIN
jgi:endonuclease-3 related protein